MAKDGGGAILPQNYPRSYDVIITGAGKRKSNKSSSKCFVFILTFLVILCIALLVFSSLVLRINSPRIKLHAVEIKNLVSRRNGNFLWVNMTMVAGITIKNKNYGRFKFSDGKMNVSYGGTQIGTGKIGGGRISGWEKRRMDNVTVHVTAAKILVNNGGDGSGGGVVMIKVSSHARLNGEILVLKKIRRYRTAVMNCTMNLILSEQQVQDLECF